MSLPRLTHQQRLARRDEKQQLLLSFLAGGETWTDLTNAARLWRLSPDATSLTLKAMVRDRLLQREDIDIGFKIRRLTIYGVTPDGIACCRTAPADAVEHEQGRLTSRNVDHSLAVQRARMVAEAAGWTDWQPGRYWYNRGLPVVPDAVARRPDGQRIAIEVERNVKSLKRRREVLSGHILSIAQRKQWDHVLYLCEARCSAARLRDLYLSLTELDTPAGRTEMTDHHRSRFQFMNLCDFNG